MDRFAYWRDRERTEDVAVCIIRRKGDHIELDQKLLAVAMAWKALGPDTLFVGEAKTQADLDSAWLTCDICLHHDFHLLVQACRMPEQDTKMVFLQLQRMKLIYPDGTVHAALVDLARSLYGGM